MAIVKRSQSQLLNQDERHRRRDFDGLAAELQDTDATARRWAARDLGVFPQASAALLQRLDVEQEPAVREAILMSLTQIGDAVAVTGLIDVLHSEDAALRNEAIEAMAHLPDAMAPVMASLLVDPDPDVRIFAVNILESLRHPDVEKWLIEVIQEDEHVNVCATAVDLLGEVGTEAALHALYDLKQRFTDEPYIGFAADLAIKRIQES